MNDLRILKNEERFFTLHPWIWEVHDSSFFLNPAFYLVPTFSPVIRHLLYPAPMNCHQGDRGLGCQNIPFGLLIINF
jgi:hypothetical protein